MGRKTVTVNRALLESCIERAENTNVFAKLSSLWEAVASLYNETELNEQITPSVVYLRVTQWNITVKTRPARNRVKLTEEQKAAMQQGKRRAKKKPDSNKNELIRQMSHKDRSRFERLIDRAAAGNKPAAVKLMCLQCSNYNTNEIKHCHISGCALYQVRPYQERGDNDETDERSELEEKSTLSGSV